MKHKTFINDIEKINMFSGISRAELPTMMDECILAYLEVKISWKIYLLSFKKRKKRNERGKKKKGDKVMC